MNLSGELLTRYLDDPERCDSEVRQQLDIPDNRYYTVSVWPVNGKVELTLKREPRTPKISKSP